MENNNVKIGKEEVGFPCKRGDSSLLEDGNQNAATPKITISKIRVSQKIWREIKRPFKKIWRKVKPLKKLLSWEKFRQESLRPIRKFWCWFTQVELPIPTIRSNRWTELTREPLQLTSQHEELLARHPWLDYRVNNCLDATKYVDFRGKTVLEIGGCNLPRDLVFGVLEAKNWVCVDFLDYVESDDNQFHWRIPKSSVTPEKIFPLGHQDSKKIIRDNDFVLFAGSSTEIGPELHREFDIVYSCNAFEHIRGLPKAIDNIHHCLKDNGILYSRFGPIWSCYVGSHFYVDAQHNFINRSRESHLPDFAHLLYSASEIDKLLSPYYVTPEEIQIKNRIVELCTVGTSSNRLFFEDYLHILEHSLFEKFSMRALWSESTMSRKIYRKLRQRHPNYRAFNVYGIELVAQK